MVEWARSCYQSRWHLFSDDPSKATTGRYYFAPVGTPHYAGKHNLGSRRWHDANWVADVVLGEDTAAKETYYNGAAPVVAPQPHIVGSPLCLSAGEPIADAIDPATLTAGYPADCYLPCWEMGSPWEMASAFDRCTVQRFYAEIINVLYDNFAQKIDDAFHAFLGDGIVVKTYPRVAVFPSFTTVICPTFSIVVLDGTYNFQQFALQAMLLPSAPVDVGGFSTSLLNDAAAQYVHNTLIADGMVPGTPIMIAGHSYGAAVGLVLAARYRFATPDRVIRYVTFGCTKPGDVRMRALIALCAGLVLLNDNDIVGVLPPDLVHLLLLPPLLVLPYLLLWPPWKTPPNPVIQYADGTLQAGATVLLSASVLLVIIQDIIAGAPIPLVSTHVIGEYIRRITLRCPDAECPVDADVLEILDEADGQLVLTSPARSIDSIAFAFPVFVHGSLAIAGDVPQLGRVAVAGTAAPVVGLVAAGPCPTAGKIGLLGETREIPPITSVVITAAAAAAGGLVVAGEPGPIGSTPAAVRLVGAAAGANGLVIAGDCPADGNLVFSLGTIPPPFMPAIGAIGFNGQSAAAGAGGLEIAGDCPTDGGIVLGLSDEGMGLAGDLLDLAQVALSDNGNGSPGGRLGVGKEAFQAHEGYAIAGPAAAAGTLALWYERPECSASFPDCPHGMATRWTLHVAGLSNLGCAECGNFNGDFLLEWDGAAFNSVKIIGCDGATLDFAWEMYNAGGFWWLIPFALTPFGWNYYRIDDASWQCNGPNVMVSQGSDLLGCLGWPATLTLVAVDVCAP